MIKPELVHLTSCDRLDFYVMHLNTQIWVGTGKLICGTHNFTCAQSLCCAGIRGPGSFWWSGALKILPVNAGTLSSDPDLGCFHAADIKPVFNCWNLHVVSLRKFSFLKNTDSERLEVLNLVFLSVVDHRLTWSLLALNESVKGINVLVLG